MSNLDDIINALNNISLNPSTDSGSENSESTNNSHISTYNNDQISLVQSTEEATQLSNLVLTAFNSNLSINSSIMPDFKPEYLKCVPDFDGNPNDLNRFLTTCDSLITQFYDNSDPSKFQNIFLINSLISKLTGTAKVVVNIQNVSTWDDLKATLRRNFADQRDESCLNRDLVMLRQNQNEQPSQFYDRVLHLLNLLCSHIDIHETTAAAKHLKKSLYNELALKTFLSGLREPLGTTIRCMRPTNLAAALQLVIQENNTHYFQNSTRPTPRQPNQNFKQPQQNNFKASPWPQRFTHPNYSYSNFNSHVPNNFFQQNSNYTRFPSQPINIRPNFNNTPKNFPTNTRVFGKPNQTNVFKPNPNRNRLLPAPQPMSVCTSGPKPKQPQTMLSTPRFQPSTSYQAQPKYTFEELYNAEMNENPVSDQYYSNEIDNNNYYNDAENQYYYSTEENPSADYYNNYQANFTNELSSPIPTYDNVNGVDLPDEDVNFHITPQEDNPT